MGRVDGGGGKALQTEGTPGAQDQPWKGAAQSDPETAW